ncbi:unnamed protein product [Linum trigynum]|uniref:Reverse transcriptase zinc-binding domain-containing protein n=1 Tax=Linum trigynum TaxID=586398 RepID=A0AAV2CX02_9ROSI
MDKASWIRLWEANVPPKLKVFVWQIFHRILPTTEALIEKKVVVLPRCPVCWEASETLEHLFLDFPVAPALWDHTGLAHLGGGLPRHTFPLFLRKLLALLHQPFLVMSVIAILWRIWRSRNWVVFEGKQFGVPALMRQFNQQVQEWVSLSVDRVHPVLRSHSPPSDPVGSSQVICIWDGAVRSGSHSAGGMVLMSPDREILLVKGVQFPVMDDPMMIEVLVLREATRGTWTLALPQSCLKAMPRLLSRRSFGGMQGMPGWDRFLKRSSSPLI